MRPRTKAAGGRWEAAVARLAGWGSSLAWRLWRRRQTWREFGVRMALQIELLDKMEAWCRYSRSEKHAMKDQLTVLTSYIEKTGADRAVARASVDELRKRITRSEGDTRELLEQDRLWAEHFHQIQAEVQGLRERAAVIRGREFARRTSGIAAVLVQHPDDRPRSKARKTKRGKKSAGGAELLGEYFLEAGRRLEELRGHVATAETAIQELSDFTATIGEIDEWGVQHDVAMAQEYQTLLESRDVIEREVSQGSYQGAAHHLLGARRLCAQLRHVLEDRFVRTRAEIDLWLDDAEICREFDLHSFPKRLTAADAQRWQDLRIEISAVVLARAEAARKAYAAGFRSKRNLQMPLRDAGDWDRLGALARAAMRASKF